MSVEELCFEQVGRMEGLYEEGERSCCHLVEVVQAHVALVELTSTCSTPVQYGTRYHEHANPILPTAGALVEFLIGITAYFSTILGFVNSLKGVPREN